MQRYRSSDEDSARWDGFRFRDGDIVVSTRTKHGTTWMQMICLLLIHRIPDLPAPLAELSPWLDWLVEDRDEVVGRLDRQQHRRVIKTHTPLDGLALSDQATYIVVARHPLDAAVSLRHQGDNIDRRRMAELSGSAMPESLSGAGRQGPAEEWLDRWIDARADPADELDSLDGVFHHLTDAWGRRHDRNVVLVHYQDLLDDLNGEFRRLAGELSIEIDDDALALLVDAARFDAMQTRAERLVPDRLGVLKDPSAFFRRGCSGSGRAAASAEALSLYESRARALAPPDLLSWLHR
ncbi:MAG TPA: sulfotransferase domain-containing protein [Acidimicrobiales bacterium]